MIKQKCLLVILMMGICATPAAAQSGSGVSAIEGTVTDPNNQPIAGAFVMILSTQTGYDRSVITDARGRYFASSMPVGTYFVQAVSPGFARTVRDAVRLTVGVTETINFSLKIANITDGFTGRAPDLGALEAGQPAPQYGPRP